MDMKNARGAVFLLLAGGRARNLPLAHVRAVLQLQAEAQTATYSARAALSRAAGRPGRWAGTMAQRMGAWSGVPTLPRLWLVQEHTGVPQSARDLLSGGFNRHDGPSF